MSLPSVTVYRTAQALFARRGEDCFQLAQPNIDTLFTISDPVAWLQEQLAAANPVLLPDELLAPIGSQEVWAAGVTYLRSRDARMEESKDAGGGTFYDKVYEAERPEIFYKGNRHRTVGPLGKVRIRRDSTWNVPEPELTLFMTASGSIVGYTVGNDMSSRSIE